MTLKPEETRMLRILGATLFGSGFLFGIAYQAKRDQKKIQRSRSLAEIAQISIDNSLWFSENYINEDIPRDEFWKEANERLEFMRIAARIRYS